MINSLKVFKIVFKDRFFIRLLNIVFQFFLFAFFLLLMAFFFNVSDYLSKLGSKVTFYAFLKKNITNEETLKIKKNIQNWHEINTVRIIKPEEGLKLLKKSLGKESSILNTLEINPLPVTLEINIKPEFTDKIYIQQIGDKLNTLNEVEWFDTTEKYLGNVIYIKKNIINIFLFVTLLFVFLITLALRIMSKSLVYRYSDSFKLLKLLGASKGFIIAPFILEGFLEALFTSFFSVITVNYLLVFLQREMEKLNFHINPIPVQMYILFILFVAIVGAISNIPSRKLV